MAEGKAGFHCASEAHTWRSRFRKKREGGSRPRVHRRQPPKQPASNTASNIAQNTHRNNSLICPECGCERLYRDGLRYLKNGESVQRWLCRNCCFRFSETGAQLKQKVNIFEKQRLKPLQPGSDLAETPMGDPDFSFKKIPDDLTFPIGKNMSSHSTSIVTVTGKTLNTLRSNNCNAKVRVSKGEAKNLVEVQARQKNVQREDTTQTADTKGKIVDFAWHLKKNGYSPATITIYGVWLRTLLKRGADLLNGESVKETIAQQQGWTCTSKANATAAYKTFADYLGINWKPPKYTAERKYPFIPLESELDALIAASGKKTAAVLQLLKETGMRIGEARRLCWTDVDLERLIVTVNSPEKKSNPRVLKISSKLAGMLNALPRKNPRVFSNYNETTWRRNFLQTRKRNAVKLQNPRLEQITFHTFRHWKGTMEYHRTKDPWHVKTLLGHKSIRNTELYINIEQAIFQAETDEFTVKVAEKPEEIKALLEVGFEYVCEKDGMMFFRKRK